MKNALIVATVYSFISAFERNDIKILKKRGYNVVCACNLKGYKGEIDDLKVELIDIPFNRNPFSIKNIESYNKIKKILKEKKFDLMHVHTPVGSVVGRFAASKYKDIKVIYTAHGFHFYKGAPIKNWLIFYPIEKYLSKKTDILITINKEDYNRAKANFKSKIIKYVPGVGINLKENLSIAVNVDREEKRKSIGVWNNDFLILSVGELSQRKNHTVIIKAISRIFNENIKYVICGQGNLENYILEKAIELGISEKVILLGQRKDIIEIMSIADLFAFPSLQEGLPVALMEAMSVGLPILVSDIRGNRDLITDEKMLINDNTPEEWQKAIEIKMNEKKYGPICYDMTKFDVENISVEMEKIYEGSEKFKK